MPGNIQEGEELEGVDRLCGVVEEGIILTTSCRVLDRYNIKIVLIHSFFHCFFLSFYDTHSFAKISK